MEFQVLYICKAIPDYAQVSDIPRSQISGDLCAVLYDSRVLQVERTGTFWLSATPEKPGSISWGNMFPRVCTRVTFRHRGSGARFDLYNTHLDHLSVVSRDKSAELIAARIMDRTEKLPVIVTGDLNSGTGETPWKHFTGTGSCGLVDALSGPDADGSTGTYHGFTGNPLGTRIDHVICSPGITAVGGHIVRFNVDGNYPSDHFPVMAELTMPPRQP
jgi:endonuclease/exonuclease/phosphatase family metal-dependent hydrolase